MSWKLSFLQSLSGVTPSLLIYKEKSPQCAGFFVLRWFV